MKNDNFASDFEELRIWIESRRLVNAVFDQLEECRHFSYRDQIQRASMSVMSNIAEGAERGTAADFARFLDISKGSAGEVRSLLHLGEDRGFFRSDQAADLRASHRQLGRSIAALAKSLRVKK